MHEEQLRRRDDIAIQIMSERVNTIHSDILDLKSSIKESVSVVASAELAGAQSVDFKASSGWVTLSIAELKGIAVLIAQHVQHCSATERQHFNNISSIQTIEELESYDLNSLWNTTV